MAIETFPRGVERRIEHRKNHGSSLTLNWGEDTDAWEVDWITSGRRFVGVCRDLGCALEQAEALARGEFGVAS
jgi:hypothetical protein